MATKEIPVKGSVEFRDAVMKLDREGRKIFVRRAVSERPEYRVITPRMGMTLGNLFAEKFPPVYMEDFAEALHEYGDASPKMIVFTRMPEEITV